MSSVLSPNPVHYYIDGQLANMPFPAGWEAEGVNRPSEACLARARELFCHLGDQFGILPYKLAYSKECGVFAAYRNSVNANVLRIEIDEELDVIANVSDGNQILASAALENETEEMRLIRVFDSRLARAA